MIMLTGGAGFIGSNIAAALDAAGDQIVVGDNLGSDDLKWRNIAKRRLRDLVSPNAIMAFLDANRGKISGVVHVGAISTTTESDVDTLVRNNIRLSIDRWSYCARNNIPFVYALGVDVVDVQVRRRGYWLSRRRDDVEGNAGSAGESGDRLAAIADEMIARRENARGGEAHRSAVDLGQDRVEGGAVPVAGDEDGSEGPDAWPFRRASALFSAVRTNGP